MSDNNQNLINQIIQEFFFVFGSYTILFIVKKIYYYPKIQINICEKKRHKEKIPTTTNSSEQKEQKSNNSHNEKTEKKNNVQSNSSSNNKSDIIVKNINNSDINVENNNDNDNNTDKNINNDNDINDINTDKNFNNDINIDKCTENNINNENIIVVNSDNHINDNSKTDNNVKQNIKSLNNNKKKNKNRNKKRKNNKIQNNNNNCNDINDNTDSMISNQINATPEGPDLSNYQQEMIDENGYIASLIEEEPKIGLENIGATCYMNATIQCLSHSLKLSNYFLNPKYSNSFDIENSLTKQYYEVIKHLWLIKYNKNKKCYAPNDFKNIIGEKDPLFKGVAANDAKDLISFLLQTLHNELNKPLKVNGNNNNLADINTQYNRQHMYNIFIQNFSNNERSIISDLFFGVNEIHTECQLCKQKNIMMNIHIPSIFYNFQIFNFIIFPLEDIRQNFNIYANYVDIYQCFEYDRRTVLMQGENSIWCNKCNQLTCALYSTRIYSSPLYLILILNRGKNNEYNVKINFEEVINLGNFVELKNENNIFYSLYGVITHIGPSSMGGHFIAFCRSPIDNKWYRFNDSMVDYVENFYRDIHEYGCPYVLFYERNNS